MNWYEYDNRQKPPDHHHIPIGREWRFYFMVPYGVRASLAPARGTDVSSLEPFKGEGCVGITGIGARVVSVHFGKKLDNSMCEMTVTVREPQALV